MDPLRPGTGDWPPQGRWRSDRVWGRIPEKCWPRPILEMGADAVCKRRLRAGTQSSFLLLPVLCTEAKKSTMSLAVFLGLSITTECPQFSRSSTWQLAIDLANMSAPDTSSTCRTRQDTRWKSLRCPHAFGGLDNGRGLAGETFRIESRQGTWLTDRNDCMPHSAIWHLDLCGCQHY